MEQGITLVMIEERYEILKAERQDRQIAYLKDDAGYAAVLGELERMIMFLMQQQSGMPQDTPQDTESDAGAGVHHSAHDAAA